MIAFTRSHLETITDEEFIQEVLTDKINHLKGITAYSERLEKVIDRMNDEKIIFVPHGTQKVKRCIATSEIPVGYLVCKDTTQI